MGRWRDKSEKKWSEKNKSGLSHQRFHHYSTNLKTLHSWAGLRSLRPQCWCHQRQCLPCSPSPLYLPARSEGYRFTNYLKGTGSQIMLMHKLTDIYEICDKHTCLQAHIQANRHTKMHKTIHIGTHTPTHTHHMHLHTHTPHTHNSCISFKTNTHKLQS